MKNEEVNGWTNHQTWNLYTMISNSEALYLQVERMRREARDKEDFAKTIKNTFPTSGANLDELVDALWG